MKIFGIPLNSRKICKVYNIRNCIAYFDMTSMLIWYLSLSLDSANARQNRLNLLAQCGHNSGLEKVQGKPLWWSYVFDTMPLKGNKVTQFGVTCNYVLFRVLRIQPIAT